MPHTVLLVDDDDSIHELLKKALGRTGARVLEAWDGEEALRHMSEQPIDLLLTDLMMPGMDGIALVRTLRETGNKKFPVAVITSMDESVRESLARHLNFAPDGNDHFIQKPFSVAEVSELFAGILDKLQPFDEITESQALKGTLSTLSFLDLIQLLQSAKLTGTLEFDDPERGIIYVDSGKIVGASCGQSEGRKAFYRMLAWTKGEFRFMKKSSLRTEQTIHAETSTLVMGGLASLDEHHRLLQEMPERLAVNKGPEAFRADLTGAERELLALVAEHGNLYAILDGSAREDLAMLRDLKALLDRSILVPAEG